MEEHIGFQPGGWSDLFFTFSPDWEDIKRWSGLGEKHQNVLLYAIEEFVKNNELFTKPLNMPEKKEFLLFLNAFKEKQILKKKKEILELAYKKHELFY
jgi:hypothetical protein